MKISGLIKLKSGSDVRGVAVETEGSPITLTDEAVYAIARAFCKWLTQRLAVSRCKIAVGNDVRISAERIKTQVKNAIIDSGCDMVDTGLSSTPSMFMLLQSGDWDCDASIMITASHLPFNRNGLKFFTRYGGLKENEICDILTMAEKGECVRGEAIGRCEERSYMDAYCVGLIDKVRRACSKFKPLEGKKIIVDAGNGAGGFFVDKVLKPLGADTAGSQFLDPDGMFPNHIPNPEDKEAIQSLSSAVLKNKADLGIIFDTDVDRAGAVASNGKEINRNSLIALLSCILLKDKSGTIVTDSVTSDGLAQFIEGLGGKHHRFKRGYRNVIDEAIKLNTEGEYCPLAIETSGHAAFKDNYFLDDGAYLVTRILICLADQSSQGKDLIDLIKDLKEPAEEGEVRIGFTPLSKDYKREGLKVIEELTAAVKTHADMHLAPDNYEGVRVSFGHGDGDGWFLVRMSLHDPIMPINFESNQKGGDVIIAKRLLSLLQKYPFLDLTKLQNFIDS